MTTNRDTGRAGRRASAGMAALWQTAAELNEEAFGPGAWVPIRAIEVREDILPREGFDAALVHSYADCFDDLPPITVQRDTLALIDGLHRLRAAPVATRDHIRVLEVDVADEDLWVAALEANTRHGRALSQTERRAGMLRLLREHPDWSDGLVAEKCGVSRRTVLEHRRKQAAKAERQSGSPVKSSQVAPAERVGRDGRKTKPRAPKYTSNSGAKPASKATPKSEPPAPRRPRPGRTWPEVAQLATRIAAEPADMAASEPDPEYLGQALSAARDAQADVERMAQWFVQLVAALEERATAWAAEAQTNGGSSKIAGAARR